MNRSDKFAALLLLVALTFAAVAALPPGAPPNSTAGREPKPIITMAQLETITPRGNRDIMSLIVEHQEHLSSCDLTTKPRKRAFFAQMAYESGRFQSFVEWRSDDSANRKYGPRTKVGRKLGNTEAGDGARYIGRGIIQLTGRDNYRRYGRIIGEPLEDQPELAADPVVSIKVACAYWTHRKFRRKKDGSVFSFNELADAGKHRLITKLINGSTKSHPKRVVFLERAKKAFAIGRKPLEPIETADDYEAFDDEPEQQSGLFDAHGAYDADLTERRLLAQMGMQ